MDDDHESVDVLKFMTKTGLDIKHLVNVPVGHVVLKIYLPSKNFHVPSQYL